MQIPRSILIFAMATVLAIAGCGESEGASEAGAAPAVDSGFNADRAFEDLRYQVELGPRPSGSEAAHQLAVWAAGELRDAGADQVTIQKRWENVVAVIPGNKPGHVLLGAHYDTKDDIPGFVGANDGASGVAVVLELARALAADPRRPSIAIALFDAEEARGDRSFEEDGTRGSEQYVRISGRDGGKGVPRLRAIEAMVLFDLVGDCSLQIPRELSSDSRLYRRIQREGATTLGASSPFGGTAVPILDDHIPFLEAGVAAVNLIDFTYGSSESPGPFWHTPEDTIDKVCPASLAKVGVVALNVIPRLLK